MDDVTFELVCKNIRVHSLVEIPPEVPTQEMIGGKFLVAQLPEGSVEPDPAEWYAEDSALKGMDAHAEGQEPEVEVADGPFDVPASPVSVYTSEFETADEEENESEDEGARQASIDAYHQERVDAQERQVEEEVEKPAPTQSDLAWSDRSDSWWERWGKHLPNLRNSQRNELDRTLGRRNGRASGFRRFFGR